MARYFMRQSINCLCSETFFSMPQDIICQRIVECVKPYQLVAALMKREGLGPLPLAKRMGHPKLQPQIHRFVRGEVAKPSPSTAAPLATYFNLPLEAIYDERAATEAARALGLTDGEPSTPNAESTELPQTPRSIVQDASRWQMARRIAQMAGTLKMPPSTFIRLIDRLAERGVTDLPDQPSEFLQQLLVLAADQEA